MLVIRLQRTGRKNLATYRLVVAEKARAVKGNFLEIMGHYLPAQKDSKMAFKTDRIAHWMQKGAIPSDTVARLLKRQGVEDMDKYIQRYTKRKSKNAVEEAPVAPVAAPATPASIAAVEAAPEQTAGDTA